MQKRSIIIVIILFLILTIPTVSAITKYIYIPAKNGHGHIELNYSPGFSLPAHITGQIESPKNGNWTIVIWVNNGDPFFNKSGITADNTYTIDYKIEKKRYKIEVDALWSQKVDTTLKVRIDGCVWTDIPFRGKQCIYHITDIIR